MKEIKLNVPESVEQEFGKKLGELIKEFDIEDDNAGVLDSLLPVTERVKTFEDACKVLGEHHTLVGQYEEVKERLEGYSFENKAHLLAYQKLCIITAALNEGWEPQFVRGEYRYYPWFYLYTQEEVDKMDEEERSKLLLVGGLASYGASCGVSCAVSSVDFGFSFTAIGARLAFKNSELAKYAGTQFLSIWSDYVFKPIRKEGAE